MYEQHFGIKSPLFPAKPVGDDVFVGPQTAKTLAGFRKALTAQEAVVTVSGPVGTGKTTLVERSIDAIGIKYKTIRVGRMEMDSKDVLEALLVVLGVQDRPAGTIQRFAALRRTLRELEERDVRVFILVEDALRTGPDTLAELEALTAADAGESSGASIVIMGDERLAEFMRDVQLAQLQQRVRRRHTILPFGVGETRGYLTHRFRQAGAEFGAIFDSKSAELLSELSGGVPRIINNIVESVLDAAAGKKMDSVSASFIASVADDEYGLTVDDFDFSVEEASTPIVEEVAAPAMQQSVPVAAAAPAEDPAPEADDAAIDEPVPVADAAAIEEPHTVAESAPEEPMPATESATEEPEHAPEPVPEEPIAAADAAPVEDMPDEPAPVEDDIPHLIQDTLPDLAVLTPELVSLAAEGNDETAELEPEPERQPVAEDIPELQPLPEPDLAPEIVAEAVADAEPAAKTSQEPESDAGAIPELEPLPETEYPSSPTNALNPELETSPESDNAAQDENIPRLEVDNVPRLELELDTEPGTVSGADLVPETENTPELLDDSNDDAGDDFGDAMAAELKPDLDALEKAMALAHGDIEIDAPAPAADTEASTKPAADSDAIPEITLDKSIETNIEITLDDELDEAQTAKPEKQAEADLGAIAAELANAKSLDDIDAKMAETLFGNEISMICAQITADMPKEDSANDAMQLELEEPAEAAAASEPPAERPAVSTITEEVSLETVAPTNATGIDPSASQRLKTVRALNTELHPSLRKPATPTPPPSPAAESPAGNAPVSIEDQINTSITQTVKALKIPADLPDDEPDEKKKGFFSRFRRS